MHLGQPILHLLLLLAHNLIIVNNSLVLLLSIAEVQQVLHFLLQMVAARLIQGITNASAY
jgi:hypothetical protein